MKTYKILIERKALKQFEKLDKDSKRRILNILKILREHGFIPILDIKKLKGYKDHYRLRIGSCRILFELRESRTLIIYAILPRKKAYKKKSS